MGWTLFQGGITKLITYPDANPEDNWTAAGFLNNAIPEGNPFVGLWGSMAGNPLVDQLVMWGLTLTGLGLILGALVRWNAFWGAVMMLFSWAASLQGGLLQGLPLAHGWVVDDHVDTLRRLTEAHEQAAFAPRTVSAADANWAVDAVTAFGRPGDTAGPEPDG